MKTDRSSSAGFSLLELCVVTLIFGIIMAMGVPSFASFRQTAQLKGAAENIVGQLRLGRLKAMSTGHSQSLTFATSNSSLTVRDLTTNRSDGPIALPRDITLVSADLLVGGVSGNFVNALPDGRFSGSGDLVLSDRAGRSDTVSVQASGLATFH